MHVRFFSSASDAVRARRPTDAIRFLAAVFWIAIASLVSDTSPLVVAVGGS